MPRRSPSPTCSTWSRGRSATRRKRGKLSFDVHVDPESRTQHHHRLQAAAAGAQEPAVERLQVHRSRAACGSTCPPALGGWSAEHPVLSQAPAVVAFEVTDTGIGIPLGKAEDHLRGVPAGRRLAPAANTAAPVSVSPSAASSPTCSAAKSTCAARRTSAATFTLYLPLKYVGSTIGARGRRRASRRAGDARGRRRSAPFEQIPDDRLEVQPGDAILLIVEDDPHYARILIDLARDKGFKVLLAMRGDDALDLAKQYQPTAVSLDVFLPDMLGWNVLSQLKQNALTRHIPVQIITLDEDRQHGLARGAFSFVTKPTTREGISEALSKIKDFAQPRRRRLLVVEDNAAEQMSIRELLGHDDIEIVNAGTGAAGARHHAPAGLRLRGARSAAARHVRVRGAGMHARRGGARRRSGGGVHRPRTVGRTRTRSCTPWRAASWSRAWNRPSGCSTRPRCSFTACSPTCRPRSSACSSGSTARTRIWSAAPCCSSMTTHATSLRCRACSSAAACTS